MTEAPPVPERTLEAVLFDAGGTLVRLDLEWMAEWLTAQGHPIDVGRLRRCEVEGRRAYDASARAPHAAEVHPPLGSAGDTREYFLGTLRAAGVPAALLDEAYAVFHDRQATTGLWIRPAEGARAVLDALPAIGLRIACVSNSDGRADWHLDHCGVREGLEFVVDSQLVGVEKPDPRIFRIALDKLGLPAAHVLYVGDIRCVDERGATAAGMPFVLIDPFGDYGAPGGPAIREIGELPRWIETRYRIRARGGRPSR